MKRCNSLGNEAVVNEEDKISHLHEDLLVHILSLLPSKDVVATNALSKQWRSLWKIVPKLDFDYFHNKSKDETFSEIVCRVLLSHKAPVLESLHLYFNVDKCDAMAIGMWIGIAYARHLRELVLDVESYGDADFAFHRSLYNCETLETLILRNWVLIDVPSPVCLKSLRTLQLHYVNHKDNASVVNLLSGCPNLENLVVKRHIEDVDVFTLLVPSLQRLTIDDEYDGDDDNEESGGYVINAPSLKYLKIEGFTGLPFRLNEIAPELEEAHIVNVSITIDEKLLGSLTSVKRLSLTSPPLEITFPTGSIFYRLVYLELSTHKAEWWNLLLLMLDSSPRLQVLKLIGKWFCRKGHMPCEKWNQPKNVSECLLLHLETFRGMATKSSSKRRKRW